MRTTRIALACFALLLAACGSDVKKTSFEPPPPGTRTVPCSDSHCTITVTVKPPASPGAKCTAQADPVSLKATHNGTVQLEWVMQGNGDFATPANAGTGDGVDVRGKPQFTLREPDAKKYKWKYKAQEPPGKESHKYDVYTRLNGVDCEKLDPYIMN